MRRRTFPTQTARTSTTSSSPSTGPCMTTSPGGRNGPATTCCTASAPAGTERPPHERACERIGKYCASANADSERQRGGLMSASNGRPALRHQLRIIDTTLRDGSHAVAHQFTEQQVRDTVRALDQANVEVIEVTHGDGLGGSSFNYGFSLTDEIELIAAAREE